jgi:D-alanyl-D-alanine carboxypeptidase/D-alanyl-D-alanine-endopeptidase (penicillin-binding protein 4)
VFRSPDYQFFKSALPQAGIDGTLRNRMIRQPILVFAKTGTATGISSLAGYTETKQHHLLSFVIMLSNGINDSAKYKVLEDKICYAIYQDF